MAKDNIVKIGGELKSVAADGVVAGAEAIRDYTEGKMQSAINAELRAAIAAINQLNIGVDTSRGVLRIGERYYKMIAYEGDVDIDFEFDYTPFVRSTSAIESPEWKKVIVDNDNKVLWGMFIDDTEYEPNLSGFSIDGIAVSRIINGLKNYE